MGIEQYKVILDAPARVLALGYMQTANAFKDIIEKSEPQFAIGIFGGWGSGKTTLMDAIQGSLDKNVSIPVQFSAWRYEKEPHLIIPLLDAVRDALADWADKELNLPGFFGGSVNGLRPVVVGCVHCVHRSRWLRTRLVGCRRSDGGCDGC